MASGPDLRGPRTPALRSAVLGAAILLAGCASLGRWHEPASRAIPAAPADALAQVVAASGLAPGESVFRPLPVSAYALDARLAIVARAQRSLDIQYYLLRDDDTGRLFLRAVRDAALRGVRVRLLVDDLYTASSDRLLLDFAATPGVEVRLFNPFPAGRAWQLTRWGLSLMDLARLNHRMHNKLMIADGTLAVIGGRNIADEYFLRGTSGNFVDFDLLLAGAALPALAADFDTYWNSRRVFSLAALEPHGPAPQSLQRDFEALTAPSRANAPRLRAADRDILGFAPLSADLEHPPLKLLRGRVRVLADDPEKVSGRAESGEDASTVTAQLMAEIAQAKEDLLLVSPYFVPGRAGMVEIEAARKRGVTTMLVTNSMAANDEPYVSAAFARYRKRLLEIGVQVYEISPDVLLAQSDLQLPAGSTTGRLHVKGAVIDRRTTFVGSMNLDFRSSRENTEVGVLVDSPELAAMAIDLVDQVRAFGSYRLRLSAHGHAQWVEERGGIERVYDDDPKVDFATRLKLLLSPFVAEGLL